MKELREAAQQALDCIRASTEYRTGNPAFEQAECAVAEALAQQGEPVAKDLMWATVAMQERHDKRIENTVATLEKIKQDQSARYQPVKEAFWWRVRIGDGAQTIGRCYTETEAQRLAAELQRAFNDGAFCVEKVVCSGDLIGAAAPVPQQGEQPVANDAARFKAQHQFLEWNRAQDDPLVKIAYEYGVFAKAIELYAGSAPGGIDPRFSGIDFDHLNERLQGYERQVERLQEALATAQPVVANADGYVPSAQPECDAARVIEWMRTPNRKPAQTAFTAGPERQAAYWIEIAQQDHFPDAKEMVPLTDDELDLICEKALFCRISFQQFARSIEAAHGIGGKQ